MQASPYDFALVTTDDGLVLGRLPKAALEGDPAAAAAEGMAPGPSTVRAHLAAGPLAKRMTERDLAPTVCCSA